MELSVRIDRFVDRQQPGWVECSFKDAEDREHRITDKIPVFTNENLWEDSTYPRPGTMPCEVISRWRDARGTELVRVSTANPLGDKSADGLDEFVVLSSQLTSAKEGKGQRLVWTPTGWRQALDE